MTGQSLPNSRLPRDAHQRGRTSAHRSDRARRPAIRHTTASRARCQAESSCTASSASPVAPHPRARRWRSSLAKVAVAELPKSASLRRGPSHPACQQLPGATGRTPSEADRRGGEASQPDSSPGYRSRMVASGSPVAVMIQKPHPVRFGTTLGLSALVTALLAPLRLLKTCTGSGWLVTVRLWVGGHTRPHTPTFHKIKPCQHLDTGHRRLLSVGGQDRRSRLRGWSKIVHGGPAGWWWGRAPWGGGWAGPATPVSGGLRRSRGGSRAGGSGSRRSHRPAPARQRRGRRRGLAGHPARPGG
jgi:hypothetical protein